MATRTVRKTQIAPGRVRYRVVVTGEECQPHTHESRQHLHMFLNLIAAHQNMLECGYSPPDRIVVSHNGTSWQAEAEAEAEAEEPTDSL